MSINEIAEGWIAFVKEKHKSDKDLLKLSEHRLNICLSCEFITEYWLYSIIDTLLQKNTETSGLGCEKCTCPTNKKILSKKAKCPMGKW